VARMSRLNYFMMDSQSAKYCLTKVISFRGLSRGLCQSLGRRRPGRLQTGRDALQVRGDLTEPAHGRRSGNSFTERIFLVAHVAEIANGNFFPLLSPSSFSRAEPLEGDVVQLLVAVDARDALHISQHV